MTDRQKPRGRPPKEKNQHRRILEQAAKLFATNGYEGCTMNDIAASVSITKAAVYHYFPTKQHIFDAIRETNIRDLHDHVRSKIDNNLNAAEQLRAAMLAHAEYFEDNYWRIAAQLSGTGGTLLQNFTDDDPFRAQRKQYENLIKKILRRGVRRGEFGKIKIGATSRAILSMMNWMTRWYRPGGRKTAQYFVNEYFELIYRGLMP